MSSKTCPPVPTLLYWSYKSCSNAVPLNHSIKPVVSSPTYLILLVDCIGTRSGVTAQFNPASDETFVYITIQAYLDDRKEGNIDDDSVVAFTLKADSKFRSKRCSRGTCHRTLRHGKCFTTGVPDDIRSREASLYKPPDSMWKGGDRRGCEICELLTLLAAHLQYRRGVPSWKGVDGVSDVDWEGDAQKKSSFWLSGSLVVSRHEFKKLHVVGRLGKLKWEQYGRHKPRGRETWWSRRTWR